MREFIHVAVREIVGVRIRLDWRGQPVTQVGRRQVRLRMHPECPEESTGGVVWYDAAKGDAIELGAFLKERCQ
jgi:hypothetical protein